MINPFQRKMKLVMLALASSFLLSNTPSFAQTSASAGQLAKIAKQYEVSPGTLADFSGMSVKDLKSGLGIARQLTGKGELSMDAAANEVLGAAKEGKDWSQIAADFGVEGW